jgi:hypothetical protein
MTCRGAFATLCVFLLAAGCGGGGSGGGGGGKPGPVNFTVRTSDPKNGTVELPNDTFITLFFSKPADPATIDTSTVLVREGGPGGVGPLHPGLVVLDGNGQQVTFFPDPWFATSRTYTLSLTGDVRDVDGRPLVQPFATTFSTGPWPSPDRVHQTQFTETAVAMNVGRSSHTATVLPNGFVLIAGGYVSATAVTATAELYDPFRDDFLPTAGDLSTARGGHTATALDTGAVLIAGGERAGDFRGLSSAELYFPASTTFAPTAAMSAERTDHTATSLADGRVLVTGGRTKDASGNTVWHRSAEIYDPVTETWSPTANDMEKLRAGHRATTLASGLVLITGGSGDRTAEIYDPATNRFRTLSARMRDVHSLHGAVRLTDGRVALLGGGTLVGEVFDPGTETFAEVSNEAGDMRSAAATFLFRAGEVLTVGGMDFSIGYLHGSVEQYVADYTANGRFFTILQRDDHGVALPAPMAFSAWCELRDGRFLVTGGLGPTWTSPDLTTAFVFDPSAE